MRNIKIISTAKYLPKNVVTSNEMDRRLGCPAGWVEKKTGIRKRYFVDDETFPEMGAIVLKDALKKAHLNFSDLDALVCTSGTPAQGIPCSSALIQESLGELSSGIPSFDINSTCLSFVVGMDMISYAIAAKRFKRVAFVSSEIASVGLNYLEKESCSLMGDGAVAVIVEGDDSMESKILCSRVETYASGARFAEIPGAGTTLHSSRKNINLKETDTLFRMNGPKIFREASRKLLPFCDRLFAGQGLNQTTVDLVIPHQASKLSMDLARKKLQIPEEKFYNFIEDHGNQIAASIPMGIHNAIESGKIKRGDKVFLIGTSAGFSIGGLVFQY